MDNFNLRKYLTEGRIHMNLNEVSIDMLRNQFVDTGRIKQKTFDDILDATNKDSSFATWLTSKVAPSKGNRFPNIKVEDIFKYKKYFDVFKRNKRKYPYKDINQYKDNQSDIAQFIKISTEIASEEEKDISNKSGVSKSEKYQSLKMGEVDGFEIYKFPQGKKDLYKANCDLGSGTEWCTATGNTSNWFNDYIGKGPIYVIINKSNPKEKYQFQYESGQYMDKDDVDIFDNNY
jgi:hypothetical protein